MLESSPDPLRRAALFTDLYELTMAQAYFFEEMHQSATFELFFRELPKNRAFLVAAGLQDVLDYLEHWRFSAADIAYLQKQGQFRPAFLDFLADVRFTGDVYALDEGTAVFPQEPLVQVVAPIIEAQLLETFVLNQIHFQSIAATKAARVVLAARGRAVVDFGSRRAHGLDAAVKVGRVTYLAGGSGTSNVEAGKRYDVPIFGTMAHSYIQAHSSETRTFESFAHLYPHTTLLVDTYDTIAGLEKVIALKKQHGDDLPIRAVRLDSGDLAALSRRARQLLDAAGLSEIKIFLSSGLDEYKIQDLLEQGAAVDGFGVGTHLAVSPDATDVDMAYKLVSYGGRGRSKLSSHKTIYPGRKQVFRRIADGTLAGDTVGRFDEQPPGTPLLRKVMENGQRIAEAVPDLKTAREHTLQGLDLLPARFKELDLPARPYPVQISARLKQDLEDFRAQRRTQTQKHTSRP
jgi:nicotinate phosphoribosyltransferase